MQYRHLCSVWRVPEGENSIGENYSEVFPVNGLETQKCTYATEKVTGERNESAELFQTEVSILLLPVSADVRKGDTIKSIRFVSGETMKELDYTVETIVKKASIITGPHHKTAQLKEIS